MFKKLASLSAVTVFSLTTLLLSSSLTSPAFASSGSSDIGGGGTGVSGGTNNNTSDTATNPICYTPDASGDYNRNRYYYLPPFTRCKDADKTVERNNPSKKFPDLPGELSRDKVITTWLPGVAQCIIGFDEFRFYGTVDNPTMAGTLSRVNTLDRCLPSNVTQARIFYPNPKDAGGSRRAPVGSVWNRVSSAANHHLDPIQASDNCNQALSNYPNCLTTSLEPRANFGNCSTLKVNNDNSISSYLRNPSTPAELKGKIQGALLAQYNLVRDTARKSGSLFPNARAASSIDLPYPITSPGSAPLVRSASSLTNIGDALDCSSAIEFVPVVKDENRPAVVIGACVVPIILDSKVYSIQGSGPSVSNFDPSEVTKQLDGKLAKNKFSFNYPGPWATMNDARYSNKKVKVSNPNTGLFISEIANNIAPPMQAYRNGIRRLVLADPAPAGPPIRGAVTRPTAYYNPDLPRTFDHYANPNDPVYKKSAQLRADRRAAADEAVSSATCWAMRLATSFGTDLPDAPPTPDTPPVTAPVEPPSFLPPSSPSAPVTPVPAQPPSIGNPGNEHLQLEVVMRNNSKEFYAKGKDFDNFIKGENLYVYPSNKSSWSKLPTCAAANVGQYCINTEEIGDLYGTLVLTPSSNFPATFPSCSGNNCQSYESHSNPGRVKLNNISNEQRLTSIWNFYTPTAQGQWMNLTLQNPSVSYVIRQKVLRPFWEQVGTRTFERCVERNDPLRPNRCTRRETVTEPVFDWVQRPVVEYRDSPTLRNVRLRTQSGGSLSTPVLGTIAPR